MRERFQDQIGMSSFNQTEKRIPAGNPLREIGNWSRGFEEIEPYVRAAPIARSARCGG